MEEPSGPLRRAWWTRSWYAFPLVLAVCLVVYGVSLDAGGFAQTEAHRAVPGFAMLETGDGIVPELFGTDYARKPPGMPWAIAATAAVFGQTEFAARLVSAVSAALIALISAAFARRWFGPRAALPVGLAAALMPWVWAFGRAAEIEALNQLGTCVAALATVDLLVYRRGRWLGPLALMIGMAILLFAKGPAGIAVPLACLLSACVITGSWARVASARWWLSTLAALGLFGLWAALAASRADAEAVTQSPGAFLWSEPAVDVASLVPASFLSALPASLALLFPWGPDARSEAAEVEDGARVLAIARALGLAWLLSLAAWMAFCVGNPRYTLPAAVLCPPLVGYVAWLYGSRLTQTRRTIARIMSLGHPLALPALLLACLPVYLRFYEAPIRATSGRDAGFGFAETLLEFGISTKAPDDPIPIYAGSAINTRPETLWYMERRWAELRRERDSLPQLEARWVPSLQSTGPPTIPSFAVIRDARADASEAFGGAGYTILEQARVHHHRYALVRFEQPAQHRKPR